MSPASQPTGHWRASAPRSVSSFEPLTETLDSEILVLAKFLTVRDSRCYTTGSVTYALVNGCCLITTDLQGA